MDAYSNVNYETWNELKQAAAKNLGEGNQNQNGAPDWEEEEPIYDVLKARGRDMEKAARNNYLFLCAALKNAALIWNLKDPSSREASALFSLH